jgi:hypothetical protein
MKNSSAPACLITCTHVTCAPDWTPTYAHVAPFLLSFLVHLLLHSPSYRLPVALLPPTWNVNCARRAADFALFRDAHAYQDASEETGGPFFFHFTIGSAVCSSKPGRQSEGAWKEQVVMPDAGAGIVMNPDTQGTGPGQWTDLPVERPGRHSGYFSDMHRRAWRLWHLQQDLMWGVVYAGTYD